MITARFQEFEFYDAIEDAECIRLMCITNIGTWHTTIQMCPGSKLREARTTFKTIVERDVALGHPPHEVEI